MSTLVVAAHPDDEVLGAGIWLHRNLGSRVHIAHTTDGSPRDMENARALGFSTREAYACARRRELDEALGMIPIPAANCIQFSFPDKESYLSLPDLVTQVDLLVDRIRPDRVLSPAYEGGHPDHDAAAFAVAIVRDLRRSFEHLEYPLYHSTEEGQMITGSFVSVEAPEQVLTLSRAERRMKSEMLACFETQKEILNHFTMDYERVREAPVYDFTRSPHPGPLLYERWGWEISGSHWRQEARKALSVLPWRGGTNSCLPRTDTAGTRVLGL